MNQSFWDLNPNGVPKSFQVNIVNEKLIEGCVKKGEAEVVAHSDNNTYVNLQPSDNNVKLTQKKKVAKVKPNLRNVENLSGAGAGSTREGPIQGITIHSVPNVVVRPLTPVGKISPIPISPIFESGINTECIQLIRHLWNLHEEALELHRGIRSIVAQCKKQIQIMEVKAHRSSNSISTGVKKERDNGNSAAVTKEVEPLSSEEPIISPLLSLLGTENTSSNTSFPSSLSSVIAGLKSITESVAEAERQFNILYVFHAQCKLVLFAKVLHARKYLSHDHLSILHTVNQLITTIIHLVSLYSSTGSNSEVMIQENLVSIFQLTEVYNNCLESAFQSQNTVPLNDNENDTSSETNPTSKNVEEINGENVNYSASKSRVLRQVNTVIQNDMPSINLSLKPISAIRLLNFYLQKRILLSSRAFVEILHTNFLKNILGPFSRISSQKTLSVSSDLSLDKFQSCFLEEDNRILPLISGFSGTPSLLGRAAIKKSDNGDQRVSKSVRTKMCNYFRQTIWNSVGETSNDLLLWDYETAIPLVLFSTEIFTVLRNSLTLGRQISGTNVTSIVSAIDSVSSSLHSFTMLVTWDEKIRNCFEITTKIKRPEQIHLKRNPEAGEWSTTICRKFADIFTSCVTLIDGTHPDTSNHDFESDGTTASYSNLLMNNQQSEGMNKSNLRINSRLQVEEEPLSDEAQMLFRLDATLVYFMLWVTKRAKSWLNAWSIPQFLALSQRDAKLIWQLMKSHEAILSTRVIFLNSENTSVSLCAKQREQCAIDFKESLDNLQVLPDELLKVVGPICHTLSLATLQSCMPNPKHWQGIGPGSGLDPEKASPYVQTFINRVIDPVVTAAVELVTSSVQEAIGKKVVHAACEAWLEHILQKKIRFSEWGAVQLMRDFMSLRDWIRNDTPLAEDARKAILQLEILKRCEGVAYLLLRNRGDILSVGKPTRRTRRVSSNITTGGSRESSPSSVSEGSIAEDDIPPEMYVPNQQMWLELRLRRNTLSLSSCC